MGSRLDDQSQEDFDCEFQISTRGQEERQGRETRGPSDGGQRAGLSYSKKKRSFHINTIAANKTIGRDIIWVDGRELVRIDRVWLSIVIEGGGIFRVNGMRRFLVCSWDDGLQIVLVRDNWLVGKCCKLDKIAAHVKQSAWRRARGEGEVKREREREMKKETSSSDWVEISIICIWLGLDKKVRDKSKGLLVNGWAHLKSEVSSDSNDVADATGRHLFSRKFDGREITS
jgi:hypothetical protein